MRLRRPRLCGSWQPMSTALQMGPASLGSQATVWSSISQTSTIPPSGCALSRGSYAFCSSVTVRLVLGPWLAIVLCFESRVASQAVRLGIVRGMLGYWTIVWRLWLGLGVCVLWWLELARPRRLMLQKALPHSLAGHLWSGLSVPPLLV